MRIPKITLSGVDVGKTRHDLVITDPNMSQYKTVRIKGRWVYGKKTVREDKLDSIVLTEKRQHDNAFVIVLAVGEKCIGSGTKVNPNDIVSCPDDAPEGIMRSSYCDDDYFIHEDLLQMHVER